MSESKFVLIPNPYAQIAQSGPVDGAAMFYGRKDLMENVVNIISTSPTGKAILMYGQKRVGTSTMLCQLSKRLELDPSLLVVDFGNVAIIMEPTSRVPFHLQFLFAILSRTHRAALKKYPGLGKKISSQEFFLYKSPLAFFEEAFLGILHTLKAKGFGQIKPVLLVDEFTYLYEGIAEKQIDPIVLKNLKTLLQAGRFSAVLAGGGCYA